MQISEGANGGAPAVVGAEPCRFPKLEECAHFHYERVQLPRLTITLQTNMDQSSHSLHANDDETEWFAVQVTSGDECWCVQRSLDNFRMLDDQLHQCIYDRKVSQLTDLSSQPANDDDLEIHLIAYLDRFSNVADNTINCGPVLNWLQMDNKGHRLLVPSEESRSINTPAVAAAYSVRRYVSQARDELSLEVGDMISVIDMASPGESMWWRGKRGFQVGFFPQNCVCIIGDKVPRNMPLPPPVVGSLALTPIKPVLRKHGKLITFFRSFILNRPSRRRLKQSGILKERVFGCDLGEHLLNSGQEIPMVLKCCAQFIETHGIVDGIYRLSGVTSNIQKLRNAFDEDRIPELYTEDILQDIHSVASLLKMYFRELPNPLCTYQLYQNFVNAVQGCTTAIKNSESDHDRLLKMREAVQKLPPPHYRTLKYLTKHLANVAKHGANTGMTTRNVAIVWAPNLLRCEALEVGGVAALQGVGVQAVVTEFLICYADLIFCDHLPTLDHPVLKNESKKCRPNSLAIATPTKLITLEEARTKHLLKSEECSYIEVGGGPNNLPKKYHTVIEFPRKRGHTKRSPLGWRLFFSSKSKPSLVVNSRKLATPIAISEKSVTESDLTDMRRKLRSVKSAESLTSGHSEPASCEDVLGPLHSLSKPPGHNRSVSHDSYFDTLQSSQNNSEGSLDLSEIQLNFELEESEMRIFSEDESLVSSPRIVLKDNQRKILSRARPEEYSSAANSGNPSPKKQARVVLSSPDALSRKRTRLEDQLSDIQYIDCNTPENVVLSSTTTTTTAVIHPLPESPSIELYQPKNKSPRNSDNLDKPPRHSLTLECNKMQDDFCMLSDLTPTPQSPSYKQLANDESSSNSTPEPDSPTYQHLNPPNYDNILTTINITYVSPPRSVPTSPVKTATTTNIYENVILNSEKVVIPTSTASLPIQQASQPIEDDCRPKSLSALEDSNSRYSLMDQLSSNTDLSLSEVVVHSSTDNLNTSQTSLSLSSRGGSITPNVSPAQTLFDGDGLSSSADDWVVDSSNNDENSRDKRKSSESESLDENVIYQQVKYFRRSIHEVNAMLELDKPPEVQENEEEVNFDSLEPHVYENVEGESLRDVFYENVELKQEKEEEQEKVSVRDLAFKFEANASNENKMKKFYEKDSLPPCLRARNLKHQFKTRSLDEDEFHKECTAAVSSQRRKSLDESLGYKTNSLPKTLNQPKELPVDDVDGKLESMHLAHSSENVNHIDEEEQKKRERIEKYKEERRKILQDKYRTESFKEDKEVILSRLRIFKGVAEKKSEERLDSLEDSPMITMGTCVERSRPIADSLKTKTIIFEQLNQRATSDSNRNNNRSSSIREPKQTEIRNFCRIMQSNKGDDEDFVRRKRMQTDAAGVEERRHTFDARERELEAERVHRVSLENRISPRKEKTSPSFCIKDVKAMFESKSKQ